MCFQVCPLSRGGHKLCTAVSQISLKACMCNAASTPTCHAAQSRDAHGRPTTHLVAAVAVVGPTAVPAPTAARTPVVVPTPVVLAATTAVVVPPAIVTPAPIVLPHTAAVVLPPGGA